MFCCSDQLDSLKASQKCSQSTQQDNNNERNGYFKSSQKLDQGIQVRNLSAIHSFSINNIVSHFEKEESHPHFSFVSEDSHGLDHQESFNNAFSIDHGFFVSYQRDKDKQISSNINNWMLPVNNRSYKTNPRTGQAQRFSNRSLFCESSKFMEQEFSSKDQESLDSNKIFINKKTSVPTNTQSTKNVTKNIGKLLLKFIWKNRKHLQHQMRVDHERWSSFINEIYQWKGENNITRQYLLVRWNGTSDNNILFRTISRHFFRKHCLSALYSSKITGKKLHLQRISKFDGAITNPQCLDYIN